MARHPDLHQSRRIRTTVLTCAAVVAGMTGLAFASAPLYDLFCRATGYGGTPMVGTAPTADEPLDRTVTVRFDANVAPGLPWTFSPETPTVEVRIGETKTVLYKVHNTGGPTTGVASFNVQPPQSGAYFTKIQCFCFNEHTLQAGETLESAVVFYVDPAIVQDPNLDDLHTITLSYTYFPAKGSKQPVQAAVAPAQGSQAPLSSSATPAQGTQAPLPSVATPARVRM